MQGREVAERAQRLHDRVIDQGGPSEVAAAMNHPVADGADAAQSLDEGDKLLAHRLAVPRLEVQRRLEVVVGAEQAQLHAARARVSTMSWRSPAARWPSPGTRSMTSITRWNRSMSFMTTMSKGVVVVPSSLYPRTWML